MKRLLIAVASGILTLTITFMFGLTFARAQAGNRIIAATHERGIVAVDDQGRIFYRERGQSGTVIRGQLPGMPVSVIGEYNDNGDVHFIMPDGTVYRMSVMYAPYTLSSEGNLLTGMPIPTTTTTWSELKNRYR